MTCNGCKESGCRMALLACSPDDAPTDLQSAYASSPPSFDFRGALVAIPSLDWWVLPSLPSYSKHVHGMAKLLLISSLN